MPRYVCLGRPQFDLVMNAAFHRAQSETLAMKVSRDAKGAIVVEMKEADE